MGQSNLKKPVLYRNNQNNDKVILISGGGSGHEPAHAGYLGEGALDVIIAGEIFASPSASQILTGLQTVKSSKGCATTSIELSVYLT